MHRLHLHSREEEEYGGGEHYIAKLGEVGPERGVGVDLHGLAETQIDHAQHDEDRRGDDCAAEASERGEGVGEFLAAEGVEGAQPVDRENHNEGIDHVFGEFLVE